MARELGLHKIDKTYRKRIEQTKAKIYEGSLRSGNKLEFEGSLIIIGDVNAGAEAIASEDVIVLGALRGLAHAGASGNKDAAIYASEIVASQVRIADVVKEIETEENSKKTKAYLKEDEIVIE